MFHFFIHGVALVVLGSALYRFALHLVNTPATLSSEAPHVKQQRAEQSRWVDSRTLFLVEGEGDAAQHAYRRGDVVTIFQESIQSNHCVLGQFQFITRKNGGVLFKAQKNLRSSNLAVWARRHRAPIKFAVVHMQRSDTPVPFVQLCRRWIELTNTDSHHGFVTMKTKFFLSGKTFTQVSAINSDRRIQIQADPMRSGWRVQAPPGRHEFHVRYAESGLLHRITVLVEHPHGAAPRKRRKQKKRSSLDTELIILGWD